MPLRLRPNDPTFYDLFTESANHLVVGARLLAEMLGSTTARAGVSGRDGQVKVADQMKDAEHAADETTHEIIRRVNSTFVTPFDREDIYALISGLDDILDNIEETADTFVLYRIAAPTATAVEQASIIVKQCEQLQEALSNLRGFKGLEKYWIEVHRLENEGDQLARKAIADLFSGGGHPIEVIKWKDIYAHLEAAIDKCEDVANIIERITIKHA